jgi:hypothetical protein
MTGHSLRLASGRYRMFIEASRVGQVPRVEIELREEMTGYLAWLSCCRMLKRCDVVVKS